MTDMPDTLYIRRANMSTISTDSMTGVWNIICDLPLATSACSHSPAPSLNDLVLPTSRQQASPMLRYDTHARASARTHPRSVRNSAIS